MDWQKIKQFLNKDILQIGQPKKKRVAKKSRAPKRNRVNSWLAGLIVLAFFLGVFGGLYFKDYIQPILKNLFSESQPQLQTQPSTTQSQAYSPQTSQEKAVIEVVKKVSSSVVSIIITKDLPVYKEYYESPFEGFEEFFGDDPLFEFKVPKYRQEGTEKKTIGGGTGFIISEDGLILTNRHVVSDEEADYIVITNKGEKYQAQLLARDPFQDLAVLKIEGENTISGDGNLTEKNFSVLKLGDSSMLEIGQSVIAIGNALGEFRNTVSVGVISGLGRRITASGGGIVETLEDVIQTDAAINRGNSGGPLLNLKGEVIGVNVAMAQEAQSIGFAIPINKAKKAIEQVKTLGKIVYPFLGIRYILITPEIQEGKNLKVDYGVLIIGGDNPDNPAIIPGSQAEKAGLQENDIILEVDGEKITLENSLAQIIRAHQPGDKLILKILRQDKEITIEATLGEKTS